MGAFSKTDIANLAISHLNVSYEIGDLDTEKSQEAKACRRFYDLVRMSVLRDFAWPFATSIITLPLVASQPNSEWAYSYRYPSDCLMFRRVLSGLRNDNRQTRVPYRIAQDSQGQLIFCDSQGAQGEYTINVVDTSRFSPDFASALSFLLGTYIAPRLTAGDPYKLGSMCMQNYLATVSRAQANSINEEQADQPVESEFVRARGYSGSGVSHAHAGTIFDADNFID